MDTQHSAIVQRVRTKLRTQRARALRANTTLEERRVWARLRGRQLEGFKFRRQHPIGEYIVDFCCPTARLVIEMDGYSHTFDEQIDYDQARDRWLKSQGCKILRFSADQDERDFTDRVVATIYRELTEVPAPGPHPRSKEAS